MSHGVHNHGHHFGPGHMHAHGNHGAAAAKGKSGEKQGLAGSTPAAQAQQAQQPSMDTAMAALDQAIQSLAANFHKDSFNGQAAPADVAQAPSTLTNAVGNRNSDMFLNNAGAAAAPAPAPVSAPVAQATPTTGTSALADPILNQKGGGGASGGVLGDRTYLGQLGGGAASGGVLGDRSAV